MKFIWLGTTRRAFNNIWSSHFSEDEIITYKLQLLEKIEHRIALMGRSTPVNKPDWESSYKILVDKYIVYYSFSEDLKDCYIEYFIHTSQQR